MADIQPPVAEIGAQTQAVPNLAGTGTWQSFVDEQEYVPDLTWPASVTQYERMRNDGQIDALYLGTTLPIREFKWSIDPNGAPTTLARRVAEDLGLPVRGDAEDRNVPMSAYRFNFDEWLQDALLALHYGHFYFEQVGEIADGAWRLRKLAPRHPRTIADFVMDPSGDGGLLGIRQNITRRVQAGQLALPPLIPIERLVAFVWRREAGSWIGRSMLRAMFREFAVKDRALRIWAVNLERAGGVPVAYGQQGASDGELKKLGALAQAFKVAEGGGGAMPFGSKLELVGAGSTITPESLVRYCDEAMARVWALMVIQLGQTETGSRALGGTFSDLASGFQRSVAKWVARVFDEHVLKDYTEWNDASTKYAPRLHFEAGPSELATTDLVALITAGAITVDPELESYIRGEAGLPDMPDPPDGGEALGALTPEEVALIQNKRNPPPPPPAVDSTATEVPPPGLPPGTQARSSGVRAVTMPTRALRRQAYAHEVKAAVDFAELDRSHDSVTAQARDLYLNRVIPDQIRAVGDAITTTKAGEARKVVTRAGMAAITAPTLGRDELVGVLLQAAKSGTLTAAGEAAAQGVMLDVLPDEVLRGLVADQADAVTKMAANGLSLAAQRKATALVGGGRSPQDVASEVVAHLGAMKHQWTTDQLAGAVQMAQTAGRLATFEQRLPGTVDAKPYASELLDTNTCRACVEIDGREFADFAEARLHYASGGYYRCEGGPRCRGTVVVVLDEQNPLSSSNPVL